uniref:RNA-directed DNA polymerase n=1 Tax=Saccoglossus kowalevskii TaxID=10224 RepID=A0ABM0LW64_SACKO|nr:PREDICTED: uncharacterized protein K02A2.6-like [Saccoglossus kowalevskii]
MALIGNVSEFDPELESWKEYSERLEHYFVANKIVEPDVKRSVLIAIIGPKAYKLLRNLCKPKEPGKLSFTELCELLTKHHDPKPSETVARLKFHKRNRQNGESIADYVASLKSLTEHCNFNSLSEEPQDHMLRDQLIVGINDERIQSKLLSIEPKTGEILSFKRVYELAIAAECAKKDVSDMKDSPTIHKTYTTIAKPCWRCDGNHQPYNCTYKDKTCYNCQQKGHISRKCRNEKRPNQQADTTKTFRGRGRGRSYTCSRKQVKSTTKSGSTHQVENIDNEVLEGNDFDEDDYYSFNEINFCEGNLNRANLGRVDPFMCKMNIEGQSVDLEIDTGASFTLLNAQEFKKLCRFNPELRQGLQKVDVILKTYTGETLDVDGVVKVEVDYNGQHFTLPVIVVSGLGSYNGDSAKIYVKSDVKPKFFKARPLAFALREATDSELDRLVENGTLTPVQNSEWATPIVVVSKPYGGVCICGDYKVTINPVAESDTFPIPKIDSLLANLAGGKTFTKLDLSNAYQQMLLEDDSKKYCVINTHRGVSDQEHKENLEKVLKRLHDKGLKIKFDKCYFFKPSVTYLGHEIDSTGIHPSKDKVRAFVDAPRPTDVHTLKSFLGGINFYGKFLKNLSSVLAPLYKLLRKGVSWHWSQPQEQSFKNAKKLLISSGVLVHYDPYKHIVLSCDASPYGIGAVLAHRNDDGSEHPIAFASRTLNDAEKNYAEIDRESLAIMFGVKHFHNYVFGLHFTLVTDHKPLVSLFHEHKALPSMASARVQHWAIALAAYDYDLEFRRGLDNGNADALSRLPLPNKPKSVPVPTDTILLLEHLSGQPISADHIRKWTASDPLHSRVLSFVKRGWSNEFKSQELKPFYVRRHELGVQEGCILWGNRVIIPPAGQQGILTELHEAHAGISVMKAIARSYVWWPHMDRDIEKAVENCEICQIHRSKPSKAPLHSWPYAEKPWERVHIDYAGPFLGKMFLIVIDAYSKWLEVKVMNISTSTATIAELKEIFCTHGLPDILVSDNGSQFTSDEFQKFMLYNGIKHVTCAPFHPSSNGLAERAVQTFKNGVKKMKQGDIKTRVLRFVFRYRSSPHCVTGATPAKLSMNRELRIHLSLVHPDFRSKVISKQATQKLYHDKHVKSRVFDIHDNVLALNYSGRGNRWLPGVIVEITGPVSYKIQLGNDRIVRRHVDQIRIRKFDSTVSETRVNEELPEIPIVSKQVTPSLSIPVSNEDLNPSVVLDTSPSNITDCNPCPDHSIIQNPPDTTPKDTVKPKISSPGVITTRSGCIAHKPDKLNL